MDMRKLNKEIINQGIQSHYNFYKEDLMEMLNLKTVTVTEEDDNVIITNNRSKTKVIVQFYGEYTKGERYYKSISEVNIVKKK